MAFRLRALLVLGLLAVAACGRDKVDSGDAGGTKGAGNAGGGGGATAGGGGAAPAGPGPTFVYARGKDSPGLDPAEATDGETSLVLVNVFDTLVRFKYGSAEVEPALATSWTSTPDRLSMTFTLREGVSFHDGTPLDASAVVANFERQRAHPFHSSPAATRTGATCSLREAVSRRPKRSVHSSSPCRRSSLAARDVQLLHRLAEARERARPSSPATPSGRLRFASWEAEEITLERNPAWWGGAPKLGKVVLVVVPDVRTAFLRLEKGQVDGIDNVSARDVERIRKDARFRLHQVEGGLSICYLAMNNDVKPFDDVRVRRAIAMAVDKPRLVDAAQVSRSARDHGAARHPGHADLRTARATSPARRPLAEAGAAGAKVTLRFPSNPRPYLPDPNATAASIRDDLRDIGLDVELKKEEWSAYLPLLQNGEHQLGIIGWSPDVPDADNYLYVLLSKDGAVKGSANNYAFYRSDAFHDKVALARSSYDPAARVRLYAEAQRIAFDDAPNVPLIAMPRTAAMSAKVEGFVLDPISSPRFAWTSKK
jgi:peptide/nickel transport system substrate-binding protein